jgi:hypothetical protein
MINNFIELGCLIFSIGLVWGNLSFRIKVLERNMQEHKDITERLTKIETTLTFIQNKLQ